MHLFILNFQECNFRTNLNRHHSHILSYSFTAPPSPSTPMSSYLQEMQRDILNQCAGTLKDSDEMVEKSDPHILTLEYLQMDNLVNDVPCTVFLQGPDPNLEPLHSHFSPLCQCCKLQTEVEEWDLRHLWLEAP